MHLLSKITHPILRIWPRPVPWTEKKNSSSPFFVIPPAETWLDGQASEFFFNGLQKLQQRAKKCIELRWECVE
jgi:hypothetical protein